MLQQARRGRACDLGAVALAALALDEGCEALDLRFTDVLGRWLGVSCGAALRRREDGALRVSAANVAGWRLSGTGDLVLSPVAGTAYRDAGAARPTLAAIAQVHEVGRAAPSALDPRATLGRALAALARRGVAPEMRVGAELEFHLFDAVSFTVAPGEIMGFIGPNGAGKTTTMRICSTLELPDSGDVLVDGTSVTLSPREARERIGFMPDSYGAYANTTIHEYLDFFARSYGFTRDQRRSRVEEVMDFADLTPLADRQMGKLSKGMGQRLCFGRMLIPDPEFMILDEPAAGLDPRARVELRELVKALAAMGKSILLSSHILTELAEMCTTVTVIERGTVLGSGSVETIARGVSGLQRIYARALAGADRLERALLELPYVRNVRVEREGVAFDFEGDSAAAAALLAQLAGAGLGLCEFAPKAVDLEDVFLSLTEGRLQ